MSFEISKEWCESMYKEEEEEIISELNAILQDAINQEVIAKIKEASDSQQQQGKDTETSE